MEFQFGTNWARFSRFAGGVIGQTLAMEGMFAFFLESSFLGPVSVRREAPVAAGAPRRGDRRVRRRVAVRLLHRRHQRLDAAPGRLRHRRRTASVQLASLSALLLNRGRSGSTSTRWAAPPSPAPSPPPAWARTTCCAPRDDASPAALVRVGVVAAALATLWQIFPSGDRRGGSSPTTSRRRWRRWRGCSGRRPRRAARARRSAQHRRAADRQPLVVPRRAQLPDLPALERPGRGAGRSFRPTSHPDNIALLYYSYHIMVGLGTIFMALDGVARPLALARAPPRQPPAALGLMLAVPLPYIANTAGWMTAELGRQPWLVYGLMRTASRDVAPRVGGQRAVLAARLHGPLHDPVDRLRSAGDAHRRARRAARTRRRADGRRSG